MCKMDLLEKEWYIEAPWGRICIIAWGDCYDPPVLVCHGTMDTAVSFRPLIKLLPRKYYYIGIDLPGNGRSDPMPPGLMISVYDLVYSIQVVVKHFRWDSIVFMGHSMGCMLGKLYDLSYPGVISKSIELDPVPFNMAVSTNQFSKWYNMSFTQYFNNYEKFNSNNKPKITKEEALAKILNRRGLSKETASMILERMIETFNDGLVRFTYDDRYLNITYPPFSSEHKKKLFMSLKTLTLTIIASDSKNSNRYSKCDYLLSENPAWPNYRVREVDGGHDVHIMYPERIASYIAQFMLNGLSGLDNKAKL